MNIGHFITAPLASGMALMTIIGTQAMTGRENAGALLLGYGGGWFLLFAIAATLPTLFSVTGRKSAVATFFAFGAGGGIAGGLIAGLLITHNLGGSNTAVILAFAIPFTLPWIVGAVIMNFRRSQASKGSRADR